jgi:hypothetical protein
MDCYEFRRRFIQCREYDAGNHIVNNEGVKRREFTSYLCANEKKTTKSQSIIHNALLSMYLLRTICLTIRYFAHLNKNKVEITQK